MPTGIYDHHNTKTPIYTKERNEKIGKANSIALKGRVLSEEIKEKIRKTLEGKKPKNWDSLYTSEINEKRRVALEKEKSSAWQGGKSFEPYTLDWTKTLRKAIRERDQYICQMCGNRGWHVHHIDYDKKNCNPDNLITLCKSCHTKTNHNREYWANVLKLKVDLILKG